MTLLAVRDLAVAFGPLRVVEGLGFDIAEGEVLGLVGESGSGKSLTGLALMGLLPEGGRIAAGRVLFEGRDIAGLPEREMRRLRGARMAMIFQEPATSLNPVPAVGEQIAEVLRRHRGLGRRAARREAVAMLRLVEIAAAERRAEAYPHQLCGGMRQRAMIAIALACRPKLLIADEPTTALDATVRAGILDLLRGLRRELGMAVLLIAHGLGVVSELCERVLVMYAGASSRPARRGRSSPARRSPAPAPCSLPSRASKGRSARCRRSAGWCPRRSSCRPAAASRRAARMPCPPARRRRRRARRAAARAHRAEGRDAEPGRSAGGLPLPHPLPAGRAALRGERAAAGRGGGRPARGLPLPGELSVP